MVVSSHHQFGMSQCRLFIGRAGRSVVGVSDASDFLNEQWTEVGGVVGLRRGADPRTVNVDWQLNETDAGQMAFVQASRYGESRAFRIAFEASRLAHVDRFFVASILPVDSEDITATAFQERTIGLHVISSIVRPSSGTGK